MMELGPSGTALLVVDMQNGFCDERGSIVRIGFDITMLKAAVAPCARLIAAARRVGLPIFHTAYVYQPGHVDGGVLVDHLMPELRQYDALVAGSWDAATLDALAPAPDEPVIAKNRPSAFFGTDLDARLRALGISRLIVCGVTTNCCVESTVRDASQLDYQTFVVADATGELDPGRHAASLATMGLLFAHVVTLDEVTEALA